VCAKNLKGPRKEFGFGSLLNHILIFPRNRNFFSGVFFAVVFSVEGGPKDGNIKKNGGREVFGGSSLLRKFGVFG